MIYTYRLLSTLLYPLFVVLIFVRKILKKEDKIRFKEKIFTSSFLKNFNEEKKIIWFHAASIGEVQSIIPIIGQLNSKKQKFNFLITTVTLSSGKFIAEEFKNNKNITHRYLPLDINFLINKFILLWKPHAVFFIDSEIWPNLILSLKDKNIPIGIINGRLTNKTFERWKRVPKTAYKIFNLFSLILTSNLTSKRYFEKLGGKNIFYLGNIKFSNKIDFKKIKNKNDKILKKRKIWCAASTHNNEEKFCIESHIKIKEKIKDILTIIIPRHIERSKEINKLCLNLNLNTQIINKQDKIQKNSEIIIINSFGVLDLYFKYAKSVFVGKSLIKSLKNDGGQNPILAASLGCKIYHGPYVFNFEDIYKFLNKKKISKKILSINELSKNLINDLKNQKKDIIKSRELVETIGSKILRKTTKQINNFLNYENH